MDTADNPESGRSADTFPQFSKLPKEVQLQIWRLAIWPRKLIVAIRKKLVHGVFEQLYDPNAAPAVMHTCRDSRKEALYTRGFDISPYGVYIWVNYEYDTVYIRDSLLPLLEETERNSIRQLIVDVPSAGMFLEVSVVHLEIMRSVEDVVLLASQDFSFWGMALRSIKTGFEARFGNVEGWKCPTIKIVAKSTGEEMTMENFREVARIQDGRRVTRRGFSGR